MVLRKRQLQILAASANTSRACAWRASAELPGSVISSSCLLFYSDDSIVGNVEYPHRFVVIVAMEKHNLEEQDSITRPRGIYRSATRWVVVIISLLLSVYYLRPQHGTWFPLRREHDIAKDSSKPFTWDSIEPKPHFEWTECYSKFQCARLELPMDYWNGTTNATVSIAVIKKPAVVPVTHPRYGGPILFNPGGPGGSGVFFLAGSADSFQHLLDSDEGKYFDYMSFDPRGVGATRPLIQCLDDPLQQLIWSARVAEEGVYSASNAAFGRLWSIATALLRSCALPREDGEPDIKQYVTTASVARDMVEIIERDAEWREKEAHRLLNSGAGCTRWMKREVEVPEALKYKEGEAKINYWGFSYGTYLGNTFAAMFPDRINRLVVDGVVDAYDYEQTLWQDNLVDTEKELDLFYHHCARVGPLGCALANITGTTTEAGVKARTQAILESLWHNPLPVIDRDYPAVISYTNMKMIIFSILYSPYGPYGFPWLAEFLAGIESGRSEFVAQVAQKRPIPSFLGEAPFLGQSDLHSSPAGVALTEMDSTVGIACTDGEDQTWVSKDEFAKHVKKLDKLSPGFGELWSTLRLQCIHYNMRAHHRFAGPWVANTSHPILEIGNSADPVTPGRYAKKMAEGFEGAVALIQDSAGHCSLAAPSICTAAYVKKYFQTGEPSPRTPPFLR